jgi:hypothetical protein
MLPDQAFMGFSPQWRIPMGGLEGGEPLAEQPAQRVRSAWSIDVFRHFQYRFL